MSNVDSTKRTVERIASKNDIGIGFVISEDIKGDTAYDIYEANKRGHDIVISCVNDCRFEVPSFADTLIDITILQSAQTVAEARNLLTKHARRQSLSGLIIRDPSLARIDYGESYERLSEGEFSVKAKSTDTGTKKCNNSVAAIVPAYNEEKTIRDVVIAITPYVDDVIVIDDSSSDGTKEIARECADKLISHPKNMGVGGAVHTGYLAAIRSGYDVVVQIDADGQHDPSYIPQMVDLIRKEGVDMVIGSRWLNESYQQYSYLRRLGIRFFTKEVNAFTGINISDVTSGFRAYRTSQLENLGRPANSHWAVEQTLEAARQGWDIKEVSVPMPPSVEGSQFDLETFLKYPPRMALTTLKVFLFR